MLRLGFHTARRRICLHRHRSHPASSSSSSSSSSSPLSSNPPKTPIDEPPDPRLFHHAPTSPVLHHQPPLSPLCDASSSPSSSSFPRRSVLALSATLLAAIIASAAAAGGSDSADSAERRHISNPLSSAVGSAVHKSNESMQRIYHHVKQTGVAASVLWQSLRSVLSSANHEVRAGFELRVAALLADIAAANAGRRAAIVSAGGGAVVDWLLDTVARPGEGFGTQAESARALAYLIADPNVCEAVLGRPRAVPNLLRFIFSCQPQRSKKHTRRSSFDLSDSLKGRSMLVAALMDIVTSNCDDLDKMLFKPALPKNAEMRDIAAAIEVIEEGALHMDEPGGSGDDKDGDRGVKGIGIKILEGTTVLGLARSNEPREMGNSGAGHIEGTKIAPKKYVLQQNFDNSVGPSSLSSAMVPGLWDDLHYEHVAVPFAAWALANWALASEDNRCHIQELDRDGHAVTTALAAPERSVKWHGSLVARLLLEDSKLPLNDSVPEWSSSLLATISQASKHEDVTLTQVALSAFLIAVGRSNEAQRVVMENGLHLLRDSVMRTARLTQVQESLAKALELLCTGDLHLSLEESQKWSAILLQWVCGRVPSEMVRSSAMRVLSRIFEDYGPYSVPISQGWLAILLSEILALSKASSAKGNGQPKSDNVKTKIDQSNVLLAGQIANQLAAAVVNLAGSKLVTSSESVDQFPLADLLSIEPFVGPYKSLKKDAQPRITAADSAFATLKGVKALTELCADNVSAQDTITDFGVLHLLRRFLLCDDYEKLAAIEAYDASRGSEAPERVSGASTDSSISDNNDTSNVRVPPTTHIRKHAARLLTILSQLPKVQQAILKDETWCKWLENCANGKVPGCNDTKIHSYARATLLNVICNNQISENSLEASGGSNKSIICPRYDDTIFLINPQLPHWKCCPRIDRFQHPDGFHGDNSLLNGVSSTAREDILGVAPSDEESAIISQNEPDLELPPLDVVFVHGLRGGPYKTWRLSEDKSSTKSGLVEKIDQEAGKQGTFWPGEWLSTDFPQARLFTVKYKTNLTQWSGASLPLQEVSSMLLRKLVAAGIGDRPVVFVTHSMGGLVVKQMLHEAKTESIGNLVKNTVGVVFYSCPHFGSKLADMPWRMGLVLRPAPSIGELRSGSPRLVELNEFIRQLHRKGLLDVLSFCETKVTPIVEGYGGWAFRMEIVPIESAYPGFGDLVVLESTDHINSCKPVNRSDPSYSETLEFLRKLKAQHIHK